MFYCIYDLPALWVIVLFEAVFVGVLLGLSPDAFQLIYDGVMHQPRRGAVGSLLMALSGHR